MPKSPKGLQEIEDEIYETTKADFERFKKETKYWVDKFGLTDLELYVEHDETDETARAVAIFDQEARMARSILQKIWTCQPTPEEIERVAYETNGVLFHFFEG